MADATTEVTLDQVHAAIVQRIHEQFPSFNLVEFYRGDDPTEDEDARGRDILRPAQLPAVLLELGEFDQNLDTDPGTEQLAVQARFAARIVLPFRTPHAKLEVRKAAAALAVWLRFQRFGLPIGGAQAINARPDDFSPELDQFEVWRVEWAQEIHLGTSVWNWADETTPGNPVFSWSPDIGYGHEGDYTPADPMQGVQ